MPGSNTVVIVGGGFYGCCIGLYFRDAGFAVRILERGPKLLGRASYNNQARVHLGYHYPRSIETGLSCVTNFRRFVEVFQAAVVRGFTNIYAIARGNSKVTANQFAGFCRRIGAPIRPAPVSVQRLFDRELIEESFEVDELVFDSNKLREILELRLAASGVEVKTGALVARIEPAAHGELAVHLADGEILRARKVFNCTYAQINSVLKNSGLPLIPFKHEIAELALVRPPTPFLRMGITVMDGPFFSMMPFPAEQLHSFSHVRYTPHDAWRDDESFRDPYAALTAMKPDSRFIQMVKDASRYVPGLKSTEYVRSLFEVKTILPQNEVNDGRPILLLRDYGLPGLHVVMGGKIDNIYDILQALGNLRDTSAQVPLPPVDDALFRRLFQ